MLAQLLILTFDASSFQMAETLIKSRSVSQRIPFLPIPLREQGVVIAFLIFWRKSDNRIALLVAFFLVSFGISNASAPNALAAAYPILAVPVNLLQVLSWIFLVFFLMGNGHRVGCVG